MRSVEELVVTDQPAWPEVEEAVTAAPYPVEVLPATPERAAACLHGVQVSTASWLGAVVYHTGGIVIDHGWLRVFGSGHSERGLRDAQTANAAGGPGFRIAEDVLGGMFSWWQASPDAPPTVHYFGPDTMEWQDLDTGYGQWLGAVLAGAMDQFYENLRWPGWQEEVTACGLDQGIFAYPPPSTVEGKDLSRVSRGLVPMAELVDYYGGPVSP